MHHRTSGDRYRHQRGDGIGGGDLDLAFGIVGETPQHADRHLMNLRRALSVQQSHKERDGTGSGNLHFVVGIVSKAL